MKIITYFTFALTGILLTGCNQSPDNAKLDALSQKLDTVMQNEVAINARLDKLPRTISDVGHFYSTNEANFIWSLHTNAIAALLNGMSGQEDSIEDTINKEVRRVGNGEKILVELKIDQAMLDLQTNFINQGTDLKMIKIKLGIPDY